MAQLGSQQPILSDRMFWAALMAALPFWGLLFWLHTPSDPVVYLVNHIGRFVLVAVASPIVEEIFFRGALQEYLAKRIRKKSEGPVSPANIVTSVIFAALHAIVWTNFWSLLVFFPSLIYGYFKEKTGGLATPIGLHAFYNAGFFLVTAR